jgi:hypothetical protein
MFVAAGLAPMASGATFNSCAEASAFAVTSFEAVALYKALSVAHRFFCSRFTQTYFPFLRNIGSVEELFFQDGKSGLRIVVLQDSRPSAELVEAGSTRFENDAHQIGKFPRGLIFKLRQKIKLKYTSVKVGNGNCDGVTFFCGLQSFSGLIDHSFALLFETTF